MQKQNKDQLLRAPSSVGRYNSTRVAEERKWWILLAVKLKARAEVAREEEGLLCDPVSELLHNRTSGGYIIFIQHFHQHFHQLLQLRH